MKKDKRIKRPGGREEVSVNEAGSTDPSPSQRKLTLPRPPLVAPAPVRITTEDSDRLPREIALAIKKWCKRNLKKNEKIHRDDLFLAINATDAERKRWGNAVQFLSNPLSQDRLIHINKGYWKKYHVDPFGKNKINKTRKVHGLRSAKKYKGRVVVKGLSISYTESVFEIENDNTVIGLRIVVPDQQIEGNQKLRELYDKGCSLSPNYKINMIHESIGKEYSPGSRRPGARIKKTREVVRRSRLLGAWVQKVRRDVKTKSTTYTIIYDNAEKL